MSIGKKPAANTQPFPFDTAENEPPASAPDVKETDRAEKRAWRALLIAFAVFLIACGSVVYTLQWYVLQSAVDMQIAVIPARGVVRMATDGSGAEFAISNRDDLAPGVTLETDASQAVIEFVDPLTDTKVATLVLLHDSSVRIVSASAPRFGLNPDVYTIELATQSARADVRVFKQDRRGVKVVVRSPQAEATLTEDGFYHTEISDQKLRLWVVEGSARVENLTVGRGADVGAGEIALVEADVTPFVGQQREQELLQNPSLEIPLGQTWRFYDDSEPPPGQPALFDFDGLDVASLDRSQENWPGIELGHGETGLRQFVDADVRAFNGLELRSTFFIAEQSLSVCGDEGSECPMMLRMSYIDVMGIEREYIQGFYAFNDLAGDKPLTCQTCRAEHERVAMGTWYTYRSGNLFASLPPDQRPAIVRQVRFYASGHAFHTYVAEVSLAATP